VTSFDPAAAGCRVCGADRKRTLLTVEAVPVNSSALHHSAAEAVGAPQGRLELTLCEACGYVRNRAFDPAVLAYEADYDNALDFSPKFRQYLAALAEELVDRYGLAGRDVVEIGCGQGRFLAELCRDGRNRAVGFDPTFRPGDEELPPTVTVVPSLFDPATDATPADLFCARHVLEHLDDPLGFLRDLRPAVASRGAALYLEVPAGEAVFAGDGCWDLPYQHVSFFSAPTLVALLGRAGYAVTDVRHRFGDQYLSVEARAEGADPVPAPDLDGFLARAREGARSLHDRLQRARELVEVETGAGRPVALWGAGAKAVTFLSLLGTPISAAVDLNPRKQGTYLPGCGLRVRAPGDLAEVRPATVFVFNPMYRDEIASSLADLRVDAEVVLA